MKKGAEDELLAISPPPEFQDSPALPPPALFRDLSPSNPGHSRKNSNSILSQAVQTCIREFADKVSYNILNEAMIISTLLPASAISDMSPHSSTSSFPISSGVSFSSVSTETSWEFLQKSNSAADFSSCFQEPKLLRENISISRKKHHSSPLQKSNSDAFDRVSKSGMSSCMEKDSVVVFKRSLLKCRTNQEPGEHRKDCDTSVDLDLCYSVPYQSDVYSLPIDSIRRSESLGISSTSSTRKVQSKRNTKVNDENSDGSKSKEKLRRNSRKKERRGFKSNGREDTTQLAGSVINSSSRLSERNNNNNEPNADYKPPWGKKKRSRSVDIECHSSSNTHRPIHPDLSSADLHLRKEKRNFGHTLLNLFKRNRPKTIGVEISTNDIMKFDGDRDINVVSRALPPPPLPQCVQENHVDQESPLEPRDFAASIEKVKDCGWYWGPLASDAAEDLLRDEPDGSFIVRDSSDAHYIFSLTFKLNGLVRHVRIEHDQGNFSFGPLTRFKAATIVEFVEKAVAHSRSGRYLFFLHRRPVLGPMQVQLLHPYSRFRHPRSLQHMCRFVILKYVRRDLLHTLPLPKRLMDYLNTPHYYFEQQELSSKNS